jgi:membrane protease YdiL (CAAX protease family)
MPIHCPSQAMGLSFHTMTNAVFGWRGLWHAAWTVFSLYALWGTNLFTVLQRADIATAVLWVFQGCSIGWCVAKISQYIMFHVPAAWHVRREFAHFFAFSNPVHCYSLAVISALSEELFFRGLVQPALGWFLASLLFGVMHMGAQPRFWIWACVAFGAGIVFGGMLIWTGSLVPAVCAHACANLCNIHALLQTPQKITVS